MIEALPPPALHPHLQKWFKRKKWQAFPFQTEAWEAFARGAHGLVNAPTGMGKTYSVWLGPLSQWLYDHPDKSQWDVREPAPPQVLWITPLRALANDTMSALRAPIEALGIPWTLEKRTGDTSAARKARQRNVLPSALITTPESLSVLLSYPGTRELLSTLRCVVVDEWHELLGNKRGTQTELALARLLSWLPELRVWGLSAPLGNLNLALDVLTFPSRGEKVLIRAENNKINEIVTLLPKEIEKFPWSGHIGLKLLPEVVDAVSSARTTLVFTNTRSQAELWFQNIVNSKPKWAEQVALHHGSLDREIREAVEDGLRTGEIRCVVCTSSLDLGVDFPAVDQVIQIGSPKGVARLLQRAGRSGHQPGGVSRIICVPTNAFELVEYSATRDAAEAGEIELRTPPESPIDALSQHVVTLASGEGFEEDELFHEVRSTWSYRNLKREEWDWVLEFESLGGPALRAYDNYKKIHKYKDRWHITSNRLAKLHRINIGTITSDINIALKLQGGGILGTVEENFLAKLKTGDSFVFAGRLLELVRLKELTATVRFATKQTGILPTWGGSRMPITSQLGKAVRDKLNDAHCGNFEGLEMEKVKPILDIQSHWSHIPAADELLIETVRSREGYHVFVYPFEGHFVHEGLGALIAWRISQLHPRTIGVTMNDYGFELLSHEPIDLERNEQTWRKILSPDNMLDDLFASVNATELAKRQFREVARVAGLIFTGYPGAPKVARQVQSSTSLLFDVFSRFDPENLLLDQARREVMERQMEVIRLRETLNRIASIRLSILKLTRFSPLAFPLWASRLSSSTAHLSSESYSDRVRRMVAQLEDMAEEEMAGHE